MFKETKYRSLYKAITWRLTTSILTFGVSYMVTGSLGGSGKIAGILFIVNSIWYFTHERLWNTRRVGKLAEPLDL
jgi:uncharacterized membrane protein